MEAVCISGSSAKALNANPSFHIVKIKHPQVLQGPACLTKPCLTRAEKVLDKLLQKASARRQICSPFMPQETSLGKFNKLAGKREVGHLLNTRQKLWVYSLPSLKPKHTHSSGKPEWKPASYSQPFLARQNWPASFSHKALQYFCYNKWSQVHQFSCLFCALSIQLLTDEFKDFRKPK